jgi:hypothetical protein
VEGSASAPADRRGWLLRSRWAVSLTAVTALLTHVVLIWSGQFHSQDGPAHMFAASALRRLIDGAEPTLARIFAINVEPDPNWITYPLLSIWLQRNTPRVAELALVTLLVVGLAAALYYAVTALGHATGPVAVAGFAVAVGWSVHTGLYNFTASVALLLVIVGYYVRVCHLMDPWRTLLLTLLLVMLYFSHPLSLVVALLVLAVVGVATTIADARAWRSRRLVGMRALALAIAVTPSLLLLGLFLLNPGTVTPRDVPRDQWESFVNVVLLRWPVQAVSARDAAWATVLACAVWGVVAVLVGRRIVQRDWSRWDTLLVLPVVTGVAAVVLPDRLAGGTLVQPRLAIYMFLALLLWVGIANVDVPLAQWLGIVLGVAGIVTLFALAAVRVGPYREIHAAMDEVRGVATAVERGHTILGAVSSRAPSMDPVVPMVHVTDVVALQAGAVPVLTLDAGSGYGPIRYVGRFDPDPALRAYPRNRTQGRDLTPVQFQNLVRQYNRVTGESFDYVMLVAYDLRQVELDGFEEAGFRLVRYSEPTGLAHLFRVTSRVLPLRDAMQRHDSPAAERVRES